MGGSLGSLHTLPDMDWATTTARARARHGRARFEHARTRLVTDFTASVLQLQLQAVAPATASKRGWTARLSHARRSCCFTARRSSSYGKMASTCIGPPAHNQKQRHGGKDMRMRVGRAGGGEERREPSHLGKVFWVGQTRVADDRGVDERLAVLDGGDEPDRLCGPTRRTRRGSPASELVWKSDTVVMCRRSSAGLAGASVMFSLRGSGPEAVPADTSACFLRLPSSRA